ncbi:hypothetical protein HAX54_013127, partial [Datura stramonium]|nr:hypothetical protein [Datura stramonium]
WLALREGILGRVVAEDEKVEKMREIEVKSGDFARVNRPGQQRITSTCHGGWFARRGYDVMYAHSAPRVTDVFSRFPSSPRVNLTPVEVVPLTLETQRLEQHQL